MIVLTAADGRPGLMTDEPSSEPRLADADEGVVEVVSDLKPGSRHWKDIMVGSRAMHKCGHPRPS
jgi:hypothetical protein